MKRKKRKSWDISQYPVNWKELSLQCRQRANNCCEICGVLNGTKRISKAGNLYDVRLAGCHINPLDTQNKNPDLFAGCQICHARYDTAYKRLLIHLYMNALAIATEEERDEKAQEIIVTVKATIKPLDRPTFLDLYGYKAA